MSSVAVCHVHTACSLEKVESWMSLLKTCEVYERFTLFVIAKEYRSKTGKTNFTNNSLTCGYCQAKYDNLKSKTMDLLQVITCMAWK